MRTIAVIMPELYLRLLDRLVRAGIYSSRCEAIRAAVRDLLTKHGLLSVKELMVEHEMSDEFMCPLCGYKTHSLSGLKRHIKRHFPRLEECPACGWRPGYHHPNVTNAVVIHLARMAKNDTLHAAWYYVFCYSLSKLKPEMREKVRMAFRALATGRLSTIMMELEAI